MKYRQTQDDLIKQWKDQIEFISRSCEGFDSGLYSESKRIAVSLRILFHNTRSSQSLFSQLGYSNNFLFWSSGGLYTPSNLLSSWSLLYYKNSGTETVYFPILMEKTGRTFFLELDDWWNEIIFDDKKYFMTRKDVILSVADQDGGAHVDPEFNESYSNITKNNSLGFLSDNEGNVFQTNNPIYASIRQIACEVLFSWEISKLSFRRTALPERKFEMRFVDENKRFKWSETDLTFSEQTKCIINKYRFEPRKYYIDRFKNNLGREVIKR